MDFILNLKNRLNRSLPGNSAHLKMAHNFRNGNITPPNSAKIASVLIALFLKNNEWHTILIKRTSKFKNDKHKGQISFPGGQVEKDDNNLGHTALRETQEEIGIPQADIDLLGPLSNLYIPVSNFIVHPFVGVIKNIPQYTLETNEVDEVIETTLSILCKNETIKSTSIDLENGFKLNNVPYYDVDGNVVWGATSMILSEFIDILKDIKFN